MSYLFGTMFAAMVFLTVPIPADAGLVPCGGTAQSPCSLCHLVSGVSILTTYIRDIMVFAALAIIVAMGILYIVSAGNPGMMETAKKGVFAALAGLVIILAAWIIVNTVMFVVFDAKSDLGVGASFSVSGGFEFDCGASVSAASSTVSGGSAGGSSGGSSSTISKPGPCTIAAVPETPPVGGGITLNASCQGGTPTSYAWTGDCAPNESSCVKNGLVAGPHTYSVVASNVAGASVSVSKTITAGTSYALSVEKTGSGGSVTSSPSGISCAGSCSSASHSYPETTNVTLTGSYDADWVLWNWNGCNSSSGATCNVTMSAAKNVMVEFRPMVPLKIWLGAIDGLGGGTVKCGGGIANCPEKFVQGTSVTITAVPLSGSTLSHWADCDSPSGLNCTMNMNSARDVTAWFKKL